MVEEKDNQDDAVEESSANKKGEGRIFGGENEEDLNIKLDKEIEKNIRIRTMPRKFKISTANGGKKTTVVGAVIMIVGLLVLGSAVYFAYIFLINPQAQTKTPEVKNTPVVENKTPVVKTVPVVEKKETPVVVKPTSTLPIIQATSTVVTPVVVSTSTSEVATSSSSGVIASTTTPVSGAPIGAKVITGLSSAEKALFGADPSKDDSDGDGFSDLSEILALYNPTGTGKIIDNPHVGVYQNVLNKYSVYYPKNWKAQNLENGDSLIFTAADNSLIQIISQVNVGGQTIKVWYNEQFPDTPVTDAGVYSRDGWQGVFQADKEIFYLADIAGNRLYTISYVSAADNDVSFYNIFLMMINSFTTK